MKVKNNYNECLTNLACSFRKYFNLEYRHNTLSYIDKYLEENKPDNVVLILCDGMGSNILDRTLNKEDFLIKHRYKKITTVFPATTVAATTSMMTGLNPVETAMLGWDMYYKGIDKTITTFLNSEKGDETFTPLKEAIEYKKKHMITKSIMNEINEKGEFSSYTLFPFGENAYKDIYDMYNTIEDLCKKEGKKFIYAYNENPDHLMHEVGSDKEEVKEVIKDINNKIEELSNKVNNTMIFVVADHGHINVENIFLDEYKDIVSCLERNTSLEARAVNFFIKENKKEEFPIIFNKYFSNDFDLFTKEDVINSCLFGNGEENEVFRDILGDYLAIAKTNKALIYGGTEVLKSQHAGYTEDEIIVPLIIINKNRL